MEACPFVAFFDSLDEYFEHAVGEHVQDKVKQRQRWTIALLCACPVLVVASIFLGQGWTTPAELLAPASRPILHIRLLRVVLAVVVGASLSVSGAVFQAVLRNPLAEPYVLGLSSGAGLATAGAIAAGLSMSSPFLPGAGFVGAMLSLWLVYQLARVGRVTSSHTLILAGVVWGTLCGSILMFIVSHATIEGLHAIVWWFLGDLQVFDLPLVAVIAIINTVAIVALSFMGRALNVLMLGDEMAGHTGIDPERSKVLLLALATVLASTSVCVCGIIGFVGLVVPHAVRGLVGPDHRKLLPLTVLAGAAFLAVADGLGRMMLYPRNVPVGIITAIVGAPFFLAILRRRQKEVWGGGEG